MKKTLFVERLQNQSPYGQESKWEISDSDRKRFGRIRRYFCSAAYFTEDIP